MPPSRRSHAAPALLQRRTHTVFTLPQRSSNAAATSSSRRCTQPSHRPHAPLHTALTPLSRRLNASFTLPAHRSHTDAKPPQSRSYAAARVEKLSIFTTPWCSRGHETMRENFTLPGTIICANFSFTSVDLMLANILEDGRTILRCKVPNFKPSIFSGSIPRQSG